MEVIRSKIIANLGLLVVCLLFTEHNFASAQIFECFSKTYSFQSGVNPIPKFNPTWGTLLGFRTHLEGSCSNLSAASENTCLSWSVGVNPSARCVGNGTTYTGFVDTHLYNSISSTSQDGGNTQIGSYDGILDYGGTSGITQVFGPFSFVNEVYTPTNSTLTYYYSSVLGSPGTPTASVNAIPSVNWNPTDQSISYNLCFANNAHITSSNSVTFDFSYIYKKANPDAFDCNNDGITDSCDILVNGVPHTNYGGYPDYCSSADCNNNGVPDLLDLHNGTPDCNANNIIDSCEIAGDPAKDSDPDFSSDGILDVCQGKVFWEKPVSPVQGIKNATINAYVITGSASAPIFQTLPPLSGASLYASDSNGKFLVPKEYFKTSTVSGEIGRGIKATITYVDDTGIQTIRQVTNYPGWDPLLPVRFGGFERRIKFPQPAIFQPGVLASVNSGSVDVIRPFFLLDSGTNSTEGEIKRGKLLSGTTNYLRYPIPAYLFFAMPSAPNVPINVKNDGVPWGYDNNPLFITPLKVANNVTKLENFIVQRVKPQIDAITTSNDSLLVPVNLLAHSYGGVITRKWITEKFSYPLVNRYVSFDGAHGGTATSNLFGSFFTEWIINGSSIQTNSAPVVNGWNYAHQLKNSSDFLLYSEVNESYSSGGATVFFDTISPFTSAFGIGRTSLGPTPISSGYCKRFVGGWEEETFTGTHSIQTQLPIAVSAARYLSYGDKPSVGSIADPGASNSFASFSAQADDPTYSSAGCFATSASNLSKGTAYRRLEVPVSGQSNFSFPVDAIPGTLHFEAYVSDINATLNLFVGTTLLTKLNPTTIPFGNNDYIHIFDIDYTGPAAKTLRLTSSVPAFATVDITFPNYRRAVAETDAPKYDQNASVIVRGRMIGINDNTIIPTSGTVKSTITAPNGSSSILTLFDDGLHNDNQPNDGIYANTYTSTASPGFYNMFTFTDYNLQGWIAYRTTRGSFEIRSTAASLDPIMVQHSVDTNGNGTLDRHVIDFTVNAQIAGKYRLLADISGSNGVVTTVDSVLNLTPGVSTQSLEIPLKTLYSLPPGDIFSLTGARLVEPVQGQTLTVNGDLVLMLPSTSSLDPIDPPEIEMLIPNFGGISGGYSILVRGENLISTSTVKIGSVDATFQILSDDTLQVQVPPLSFGGTSGGSGSSGGQSSIGGISGQTSRPVAAHIAGSALKKDVQIKIVTSSGEVILKKAFSYVN